MGARGSGGPPYLQIRKICVVLRTGLRSSGSGQSVNEVVWWNNDLESRETTSDVEVCAGGCMSTVSSGLTAQPCHYTVYYNSSDLLLL